MKLFGRGKASEVKTTEEASETISGCLHPLTHRIALREDPSAPGRVTGAKCLRCGQVVSGRGPGGAAS